jgi:hypothetical protein
MRSFKPSAVSASSAFSIRQWAFGVRALVLFFVVSIAWTWPLATRLSTRIAHDSGDPVLNAWILWWNTQALPFTSRWWNAEIFYPAPGALALSEHLFGIAVLTAPLHVAGLNPAAAYNSAVILTCWLSCFFAYLLGRHLTGSTFGGIVCGVAFGLAPYRAGQLAHLQVLAAQWMPLTLFAMHRYVSDERQRWLVLFAAGWLLQALSNGYYLLFFPVLIGAWLLWFGTLRQKLTLGATFAASSLLLIPTLLKYREVHALFNLRRNLGEMRMFSAKPSSFFQIPDLLAFWPGTRGGTPEGDLFPGVTIAVLTLVGAILLLKGAHLGEAARRRSVFLFYTLAALLFWWLSFGPDRSGKTLTDVLTYPYTLLTWLPGFEGLRVPARFAMLAALCVAVAASIAATRLVEGLRGAVPKALVAAVILAGVFADGWLETMPLAPVPSRFLVPPVEDALVIELPLGVSDIGIAAMYRAISHGRPLVNGYSGHFPPHHGLLARALRRGDPTALTYLAAGRPLIVLVHRRYDANGRWRSFVESAGGIRHEESGLGPVFVVPPQPRQRQPPPGDRLHAAAVPAPEGYAALDLGSERTVRLIEIDLEERYEDVTPESLVEISADGNAWTPAWEGWTGGLALGGTLEDPHKAPLRITLPDVRTRYIRISPAPPWIAEAVRVFSAR